MKTKRYLVNERQLGIIQENIMVEKPSQYAKGDPIQLMAPVRGFNLPIPSTGTVAHVDAVGTVRVEFNVGGKIVVVPINPDVDQISKVGGVSALAENVHKQSKDGYVVDGKKVKEILTKNGWIEGKDWFKKPYEAYGSGRPDEYGFVITSVDAKLPPVRGTAANGLDDYLKSIGLSPTNIWAGSHVHGWIHRSLRVPNGSGKTPPPARA